jgi:hypothetical protein
MSVLYSASFSAKTFSASTAYDLFSLKSTAGHYNRLVALYLSQNVQAQDANDAQIAYAINSGATTQGSGGSSLTPVTSPRETTSTNVTARGMDTTQSNTGTIITLHQDAFNDRAGLIFIPTPEMSEAIFKWGGASTATCLTVTVTSTGSTKTYTTGFNGTIYWAED